MPETVDSGQNLYSAPVTAGVIYQKAGGQIGLHGILVVLEMKWPGPEATRVLGVHSHFELYDFYLARVTIGVARVVDLPFVRVVPRAECLCRSMFRLSVWGSRNGRRFLHALCVFINVQIMDAWIVKGLLCA